MGYNDFGDFFYAHGQLADAFKNYVRTRDYCTTSKHIIHMCLSAILVSIETGQFTHVTSYVNKAEQTPEALDQIATAKVRCAAGLAHLEAKKYKLAARKVCSLLSFLLLILNCAFNFLLSMSHCQTLKCFDDIGPLHGLQHSWLNRALFGFPLKLEWVKKREFLKCSAYFNLVIVIQ